MKKKACFLSLGCKVNKYEIDCMANILQNNDYDIFTHLEKADVYVVNTCAVTQEAEKKSRQYIAKINKLNPKAEIVVCGCASQNNMQQFTDKENVVAVFGNAKKENILPILMNKEKQLYDIAEDTLCLSSPLKTKTRAYLKVQDGCNNFCSYCIIPYVRGRSRSRDIQDIVAEAHKLAEESKEIVITGIDVSSFKVNPEYYAKYSAMYDINATESLDLSILLDSLKDVKARIRMSSLEVHAITNNLLQAMQRMKNFTPHLHLSLQSGSDKVLKDMNRKYTRKEYLEKIALIKKYFPNANITTDVIIGFPTESEQDVLETIDLIEKVGFGDAHVFTYSHRSGTVASKLKDINKDIKRERMKKVVLAAVQSRNKYIKKNINKKYNVLIEDCEKEFFTGYTENYLKAYIADDKSIRSGDLLSVKVIAPYQDGVLVEKV